ncbi:phage baseplate assembly protein V [Paenibacillus xylanexedens]|uniref:phage baseplate assembly protein V n=1 Tax=Paenibacillus xylanexedens TaxID=528191 RepID=UPI001F028764|nr:phage baseplate assembly protein V [Paenibacillus xylanexedens]MCF7753378.1 phage baseplate assembly protein V [Paenibacillus xylanexedens]
MADIQAIIRNLFRVGICSTSDASLGTLTATFPDRDDMVSDELAMVYKGGWGASNTIPQPGDTVVCLFLGNGMSDGICLGKIYDTDDPPGEEGQEGIFFEDGSYVYFDHTAGKLMVNAMGGVDVKSPGNVEVSAQSVVIKATTVTIDGDLSVTGMVSASNL